MSRRTPYYQYRTAVIGNVDPAAAGLLMGENLKCKGIHLPDDPNPKKLRGDERILWDAAYQNALDYYKADNDKLAQKTAWKTLRLFFANGKRSASLPPVGQGPVTYLGNPGDLVDLGVCIEYTYIDGNADLHVLRFSDSDTPSLFWSTAHRTLYIFPQAEHETCREPDPWSNEAVMFKKWAQREAQCARDIDVPEVDVQLLGNLDTLIYRSDKWHDRNPDQGSPGSQEYIHQVGDGVGLWQSTGNPPAAIVMTGGCLDVEERGIIH